jgi:hypothetical protein
MHRTQLETRTESRAIPDHRSSRSTAHVVSLGKARTKGGRCFWSSPALCLEDDPDTHAGLAAAGSGGPRIDGCSLVQAEISRFETYCL